MIVVGEYLHAELKRCALDETCRDIMNSLGDWKKVNAGMIALASAGFPRAGAMVAVGMQVWWAYQRTFDAYNSGSSLRRRVDAYEQRLRYIGVWKP